MLHPRHALYGAILLSTLSLAACGTPKSPSTTSSSTTGSSKTSKSVAKVQLTSPAITQGTIPALYTCDGKNISPPFQWGAVPAGIKELVLFAVREQGGQPTPSVEWALAGLKPTLHKVAAGALPSGAYLEQASQGQRYSICPAKGQTAKYKFLIYALPAGVTAGPGISGPELLTNLTSANPQFRSPAEGGFNATYKRK
jgi:phosphatidylethanolamine-binding protein (PEBP) family uncharacterized protein